MLTDAKFRELEAALRSAPTPEAIDELLEGYRALQKDRLRKLVMILNLIDATDRGASRADFEQIVALCNAEIEEGQRRHLNRGPQVDVYPLSDLNDDPCYLGLLDDLDDLDHATLGRR